MDLSSCFFLGVWHAWSWTPLNMLVMKVWHSRTSWFNNSKWKFLICQSTYGLCKASQNNLMMTRFFKKKMTLKMTSIMWKPMATFNALVSCVTSPNERFRPSMTSTRIGVFFFTNANLYCYTNFLLMKHADALESKSVWAFIIMGLLHLIVIGTKTWCRIQK